MSRARRRSRSVPRLERLESRALLSLGAVGRDLFVRFRDGTPAAAISRLLGRLGARPLEAFPDGPALVEFATPAARGVASAALARDPRVLYVQADRLFRAQGVPTAAARLSQQWGLGQH